MLVDFLSPKAAPVGDNLKTLQILKCSNIEDSIKDNCVWKIVCGTKYTYLLNLANQHSILHMYNS
jgi:hypothetical protein